MNGHLAEPSRETFDELVLPHLDSAYNLARWLVRNNHDAEDVVQDAFLRAFRYFGSFHGGDPRAWLLKIVRNTSYTWLEENRRQPSAIDFDEQMHSGGVPAATPEALLLQTADNELVERALRGLPVPLKEVLVLRELQDLSYEELADVMDVPIGTVMSRLSRARERFRQAVGDLLRKQALSEPATALLRDARQNRESVPRCASSGRGSFECRDRGRASRQNS